MPIRCSATSKCWFLFIIAINHIIHTYHTMVAELRRVCWLRHGGREGGQEKSMKIVTSFVSDNKFYCFYGDRGGREV